MCSGYVKHFEQFTPSCPFGSEQSAVSRSPATLRSFTECIYEFIEICGQYDDLANNRFSCRIIIILVVEYAHTQDVSHVKLLT